MGDGGLEVHGAGPAAMLAPMAAAAAPRSPAPSRGPARVPVAAAALVAAALLLASCGGSSSPGGGLVARRAPGVAPSAEVVALATGAMNEEGQSVFFDARPKVLDRAAFGIACPVGDLGPALGCFRPGRIAILRITRPELTGIMEVTAVHEMLHAVYAELPDTERRGVDALVAEVWAGVKDPDIREVVESYPARQRPDEIHSILATEVAALSPALESHYSRFLSNRPRVVAANDASQAPFKALKARVEALTAQLKASEAQLTALESRLEADEAELESLDRQLDAYERQGNQRGYNSLVTPRNNLLRSLRAMIDQFNRQVDAHNAKVDELNGLALEQDQLVGALEGKGGP